MNTFLAILTIAGHAMAGLPAAPCAVAKGFQDPETRTPCGRVEAVHQVIARQYQAVLGRQPDASGLDGYTRALLHDGKDEQWLHDVIARSPEARQRARRQQQRRVRAACVVVLVLVVIGLRRGVWRAAQRGVHLLDRAAGRVPTLIPASWASFCWALALLFMLRGLFFLSVYPPLEGFDEHQHIAYIAHLIQTGTVPKYGEAVIPQALYPDLAMNPHSPHGWRQLRAIGTLDHRHFWPIQPRGPVHSVSVMLTSAFHPPLYYQCMAPLFKALSRSGGFLAAVYGVRMVSLACAALSIFFFVFPLRSFFGAEHASKLGTLAVSLSPMYLVYCARVSPDGLALLGAAIVFFLLARLDPDRRPALLRRAVLIGMLLGTGTYVRASIIMWLPASLLFLLWLMAGNRARWRNGLLACLVILAAYAVITGGYFRHNMAVYGQPVPGQEGLRMAALGKGIPDLVAAVKSSDVWTFCFLRMIKHNLWTSGWTFLDPHPAFVQVYVGCVVFCLLGCVPWVVRRTVGGARTRQPSRPLVILCICALGSTLLGAYLHGLSSRVAYGAVITPPYYLMPAFIPFLALTLNVGRQWPGQGTWMLCTGLLSAVFVATEVHSLLFVGATYWACTHTLSEKLSRLAAIHPLFPSPAWMPALAAGMGFLWVWMMASIRISQTAARATDGAAERARGRAGGRGTGQAGCAE